MKFVAREPLGEDNVNISKTSRLRELSLLVGGLSGLLVVGILTVFLLVDVMVFIVTPSTEKRIFEKLPLGQMTSFGGGTSEPGPDLKKLFTELTTSWEDAPYDFRLVVSETSTPNAFALPGGTILMTRGLCEMVSSENELAFVLGHELGHFRNRDHLRRVGRLMAARLVVAAVFSSSASGALEDSMEFIEQIVLLGFSREQELAADRFGAEILAKVYGHLGGTEEFFQSLTKAGHSHEGATAAFLSTHPVHEKRTKRIERYAKELGVPASGEKRAFSCNGTEDEADLYPAFDVGDEKAGQGPAAPMDGNVSVE